MPFKPLVSLVLVTSLGLSGLAQAQHRPGHSHGHPGMHHGHHNPHPPVRRDYHDGRGAGPNHAFHRGDRLPVEYRGRQYVVDNWREHHLSAPPRGYHWVQTGGDYVLAAIGTGVILQLFLGN